MDFKHMFNKPKTLDIVMIFKHMSLMIKSGVNVFEALSIITEETQSKVLKDVLEDVLSDVQNGKTLADAMAKHDYVFNDLHINLVRIGEESGTLDENVNYLSDYLTKEYQLKKKIQGAMIYPVVIFFGLIGIGIFIVVYILPKISDFYSSFNAELPFATRMLMSLSDKVEKYGFFMLIGAIGFVFLASVIWNLKVLKLPRDVMLLKVPVFGNLILKRQLVQLTRNFGILVKSGVPVVKSFRVTSLTLTNAKFRKDVQALADQVNTGKSISTVLEGIRDTPIPTMVIKMWDVGDKTGSLSDVSLYVSDFYSEDVENITENLSSSIEPILLVMIGLFVGFVAFAILTPIYSITSSI